YRGQLGVSHRLGSHNRAVWSRLRNLTFATDGLQILLWVEMETGPLHAGTDPCANLRRVLPDATREDDRARSAHPSQIGADVFASPITEDFNGQTNPAVIMLS